MRRARLPPGAGRRHLDRHRAEPGGVIHDEHEQLVAALAAADAGRAVCILERHLQPIREIITRLPGGAG